MASSNAGGGAGAGGPERDAGRADRPPGGNRPISYQPEERYWTDYLRIALPVIGLVLLIGLLWFWASSLIGGGTTQPPETPVAVVLTPINQATPIPTPSPTAVVLQPTPLPPTPAPTPVVNVTEAPPTVAPTEAAAAGTAANACANLPVYQPGTIVETTDSVNLRDGPSTDSNVVVTLQPGTRLQITGNFSEGGECDWWPVTVVDTGQSGYVIEQYLKLSQQ
jgi:uncharacterized protein YgiM (DUF1202 family)